MRQSTVLLGVPVDDVTTAEAIDDIAGFVRRGRRDGTWHQVATINLDFVTNALRHADVMEILQTSSLNVADGMPILWGARLLGAPLRERVAGADLVPALVDRGARDGWNIYFFGAAPGVAEHAARLLSSRHPGAKVIGNSGPALVSVDRVDASLHDEIAAARPDILCVALGNPKQERWIERYAPTLGVPVLIGVGGTFDFLVGGRRRAPSWMQRTGVEWVFRMMQEPARLGPRYLTDFVVCGPRFVRQWWRGRHGRRDRWSAAEIGRADGGPFTVRAVTGLDIRRDPELAALDPATSEIVLDVSAIGRPDVRTIGALTAIARASRGRVTTTGLGPSARRRLASERVLDVITGDAWRR